MYFILNETNQIIAADTDLLELCGLTHIDQLNLNIALGKTKFDHTSEENLVITEEDNDTSYPMSKVSLSSMLGHLTLVDLKRPEEGNEDLLSDIKTGIPEESDEDIIAHDLDTELYSLEPETEETGLETEAVEEDTALMDLDLGIAEETAESIDEIAPAPSEDTDILDLDLDFALKEEEAAEVQPVTDGSEEILIDIAQVSQRIGVSEEDYDTFLNEYINTALELEQDLKSADAQKRADAIGTLTNLSDLLQLPMMSGLVASINTASEEKQQEAIGSFYSALSRITTSQAPEKEPEMEPEMELFGLEEEPKEEAEPAAEKSEKGFGSISLEGIKPIYFDFRLEEAANDLSLPIDLIEEFVRDFIEQAHVETEKMLKAYEEGDLDSIQKIGHLLKGASSNLRINPLSDTLYKIQFCEDVSKLEAYIKDYWAHFLSFEIQINALAK
ncbi:MAG TPA: hypothetical protein VIM88_09940 [Sulfurovum sp.]|uniref:hypothetical protein n=1 Tax=Sulfurovum sp. TaxID=1969726 RepID=UPI002F959CFB